MDAPQLTITIKEDGERIGGVPVDALIKIVDHLRKLVDEVSIAVGLHYGVESGTQLVVTDVRHGSVVYQMAAIPRRVHVRDISGNVVASVAEGLALLQHKTERPPFFSDRALNECSQLVRPLKQDIKTITISATSREGFRLGLQIQDNVRPLLAPRHRYWGSVEGRIYRLEKKRRRFECTLYDRVRRQPITCQFDESLLTAVRDAFDARVLIAGHLYADEYGRVQRVEMQEIRHLRDKADQPSLESLLGSDPGFTGGVDSVKYVRAMRDEHTANS